MASQSRTVEWGDVPGSGCKLGFHYPFPTRAGETAAKEPPVSGFKPRQHQVTLNKDTVYQGGSCREQLRAWTLGPDCLGSNPSSGVLLRWEVKQLT